MADQARGQRDSREWPWRRKIQLTRPKTMICLSDIVPARILASREAVGDRDLGDFGDFGDVSQPR